MATIALTADNLENTIENNDIVLIDFWADWCGPCKQFGPVFEEVSKNIDGVTFAKCDTEAEQAVAAQFGFQSIPTVAAFREQVLVFSQPGALPQQALEELITQLKGLDMDDVRRKIADSQAQAELNGDN